MSVESTYQTTAIVDRADGTTTRRRVAVLAAFLAVSGPLGIVAFLLWPHNSGADGTFLLGDLDSGRMQWWWLLTVGAVLTALTFFAQAIATLVIVGTRGSSWADWGAGLMFVGGVVQAVAIGIVEASYFAASEPALGKGVSTAVFTAVNNDQGHLFGALLVGEATAVLGTVLQAVALLRSHTVPKWVPVASLFTVLSIIGPVETTSSLIFSIPMAAAAVGIAYYAYQQVAGYVAA
jgi:hypothetical protein